MIDLSTEYLGLKLANPLVPSSSPLTGELDSARELQLKMISVNQAVTAIYGVPGLKTAMDMRGYFGGDPRPPLLPSSEQVRSEIEAILKKADLLN